VNASAVINLVESPKHRRTIS